MEIEFTLSPGANTHPKSNCNTLRTLSVAHLKYHLRFFNEKQVQRGQIKVPKSRGALATGFTYAPV